MTQAGLSGKFGIMLTRLVHDNDNSRDAFSRPKHVTVNLNNTGFYSDSLDSFVDIGYAD